jgi:hypothetical protein
VLKTELCRNDLRERSCWLLPFTGFHMILVAREPRSDTRISTLPERTMTGLGLGGTLSTAPPHGIDADQALRP